MLLAPHQYVSEEKENLFENWTQLWISPPLMTNQAQVGVINENKGRKGFLITRCKLHQLRYFKDNLTTILMNGSSLSSNFSGKIRYLKNKKSILPLNILKTTL